MATRTKSSKKQQNYGIPIVGPILNLIIGSRNDRFVKRYNQRVQQINSLEPQIRRLTDSEIRLKAVEFRARVEKGETGSDLLPEAFAVAREAMDRAVGIRNIFNPKLSGQFDFSKLPGPIVALYEKTKAEMDALPVIVPRTFDPRGGEEVPEGAAPDTAGDWLGATTLIPGWMQADIPVEVYEAVRAVLPQSKPPFRARPFDVQLIGGMVITGGKISEMKTGEGKTIVAPLATYLACLEGLKVHVVTVNDYLVQRDRDWTFPYFRALGLTVGAIHPMHTQDEGIKRLMYHCDVVYGTTSEFGFDYLRDNMKRSVDQQVQRFRQFAIVDEVDSILIDEARTPLIISGPAHEDSPRYDLADRLARHLLQKQVPWQQADDAVRECQKMIKGLEGDIRNAREKEKVPQLQSQLKEWKEKLPAVEAARTKHTQYFELELEKKQAHLTHDGIAEAQRVANIGSFYVGENMDVPHLLEQSVRAHVVYQRDRDYIVAPQENPHTGRMEPSVVIVDTFTGRPMVGRQWSDGLHQAVEAKEGVPIKQETQTVATITIQNFFKMYQRLAGMTGTADTEAQEFHDIYRLDVVSIPTNVPVVRRDFDDLMFLVAKDKWNSIVDEIKQFHDVGRPVLVGTTSVEKSEMLAQMLQRKHGIKHEVLNAKQHEREANIVESAGQLGQVMIATNMAGRGTDIKLGRVTRESLLEHWLKRGVCSRGLTVESSEEELRENVYRKIAPLELEIPKREAEEMPAADLELRLLRHWAYKFTVVSPKKIDSMEAEPLRKALDETGRCLLHRIRWFDSVEDLGGLHVIGTERHESRRIDNQLRGRCGRQGDNGSSRFFISLEDDLMKMFAGETTMRVLSRLGMKEGDAIEHPMLSKSVERAQRKVEERNFQIRKNILEYDEVMEHQRRSFYGLRQRTLEGRDVRGLMMQFVTESVRDAVRMYLGKDYAGTCASEFVRQAIDITIFPERLRGMELEEMINRIRADAKQETRGMIAVTLGEYLPHEEGEISMDFDAEGLARWAKGHFGVDFDAATLRSNGFDRREIEDKLAEAASERIDNADLSGLARFVEKDFGAGELANWADRKYGIKVPVDEINRAALEDLKAVERLFTSQAEEMYSKREIEYPVDFAMDMTRALAQQNPQGAAEQLVRWANQRYAMGWTMDIFRTMSPLKARESLLSASEKFVADGTLMRKIGEATAAADWESLRGWFKDNLQAEPPEYIRRLRGEERADAIRARVETVLRAELLYFERTIMLETLDSAWKDHLYSMDQLRDTINYRAFSQQDPRIEYKREGSKMFQGMLETCRDRVTDMLFRVKLSPVVQGPPGAGGGGAPRAPSVPAASGVIRSASPYYEPAGAPAQPRPAAPATSTSRSSGPSPYYEPPSAGTRPSAVPATATAGAAAMATENGASMVSPDAAAPMSRAAQRDLDAAQRAGTDPGAKKAPAVRTEKRVGRNDPCPCGSGRKYKKCCGAEGAGAAAADDDKDEE